MTNPLAAKPVHRESTYQMLVASEKERTVIEDIVYLLLVIATATTIWQFCQQPVTFVDLGADHAQTAVALHS